MSDTEAKDQIANPVFNAGVTIEADDAMKRLPIMSVIRDEHGIDAVKLFRPSSSITYWADDSGVSYVPVLPVTILSVPSTAAKDVASRGYLLDEEARAYWEVEENRKFTAAKPWGV